MQLAKDQSQTHQALVFGLLAACIVGCSSPATKPGAVADHETTSASPSPAKEPGKAPSMPVAQPSSTATTTTNGADSRSTATTAAVVDTQSAQAADSPEDAGKTVLRSKTPNHDGVVKLRRKGKKYEIEVSASKPCKLAHSAVVAASSSAEDTMNDPEGSALPADLYTLVDKDGCYVGVYLYEDGAEPKYAWLNSDCGGCKVSPDDPLRR